MRITKLAHYIYNNSPATVINRLKMRTSLPKKPIEPLSKQFLFSSKYDELMSRHLPFEGVYDSHEAQNETKNFLFRHHTSRSELGIFRWRGMQKYKNRIIDLIENNENVVDFGGAACPLGFGSKLIDLLETDMYGQKVPYQSISDIDKKIDVLFTSHTLEHLPDLNGFLQVARSGTKSGGVWILHCPSLYCERWRSGNHKNDLYNDHVSTFGLSGTKCPEGLLNYIELDGLVAKYAKIEHLDYCGDDSIMIFARIE